MRSCVGDFIFRRAQVNGLIGIPSDNIEIRLERFDVFLLELRTGGLPVRTTCGAEGCGEEFSEEGHYRSRSVRPGDKLNAAAEPSLIRYKLSHCLANVVNFQKPICHTHARTHARTRKIVRFS